MEAYHRLTELSTSLRTSVAIGNFDGCHLGHVALLTPMIKGAKEGGMVPCVLTFYPHPVEVLNPGKRLERLSTATEKLFLFESMGVEMVLVEKFDRELSRLSPTQFFEKYLILGLGAKSVHVGSNFQFGKNRSGNIEVLRSLCDETHLELHILPPYSHRGVAVSSSYIRSLIAEGRVKDAGELLGRPYSLSGPVTAGEKRGRQLGFPTANVRYPAEKVLPKYGVYVSRVIWQKQAFCSVTNVGIRPTFSQESPPVVEVHLIDFDARLYDEPIELQFFDRIRDERRFETAQSLRAQIEKDVERAKHYRFE